MRSSFIPSLKAAQEVNPIKVGIVQPSTPIFTSLRGAVTLNTPSSLFNVPLRPVISSRRAVFNLFCCDRTDVPTKIDMSTKAAFDILFFIRKHYLNMTWNAGKKLEGDPVARPRLMRR